MSDSATMNDDRSLVINCEKVTRTYNEGPGKLTIFSDISLQVSAGESVGIVGSSGAGKTTLLNLLGGWINLLRVILISAGRIFTG